MISFSFIKFLAKKRDLRCWFSKAFKSEWLMRRRTGKCCSPLWQNWKEDFPFLKYVHLFHINQSTASYESMHNHTTLQYDFGSVSFRNAWIKNWFACWWQRRPNKTRSQWHLYFCLWTGTKKHASHWLFHSRTKARGWDWKRRRKMSWVCHRFKEQIMNCLTDATEIETRRVTFQLYRAKRSTERERVSKSVGTLNLIKTEQIFSSRWMMSNGVWYRSCNQTRTHTQSRFNHITVEIVNS